MLEEDRHLGDCLENTSPIGQQICYGVTRNWFYYDCVIEALLDKPLPEKHLDLWLILMAGLYSMDHLHRPQHASVNHAVESVIKLGKPWLAFDLPAGGKRLLQQAEGYDYTIKSGQITFEKGILSAARPGGLIRGPQEVAGSECPV